LIIQMELLLKVKYLIIFEHDIKYKSIIKEAKLRKFLCS
jgi:hypothetical protein